MVKPEQLKREKNNSDKNMLLISLTQQIVTLFSLSCRICVYIYYIYVNNIQCIQLNHMSVKYRMILLIIGGIHSERVSLTEMDNHRTPL